MGKFNRQNAASLRVASIGTQFFASTVIGGAVGKYWLDPLFGSYPTCTVIGGLFGIAAGFLNLYQEVKILDREDAQEKAEKAKEDAPKQTDEPT